LIWTTLILIDSYSPVVKDKQESFSNRVRNEKYNYQEIQNYLENNSWNKREKRMINKSAMLNKIRTALLLYLEDNHHLPQNLNELLGEYLIEVPVDRDILSYTNSRINLLKDITEILKESNLNQNKLSAFKPYSLLVDSLAKRIYLMQGENIVKGYPIGVGGVESPTPKGEFRIKNKLKLSGKEQKVYGDYWIGIDLWTKGGGYGIHGSTDQEVPVSKQNSRGCIRMRAADLQELYQLIPLRTKIVIK
jgi:hypothetical protein